MCLRRHGRQGLEARIAPHGRCWVSTCASTVRVERDGFIVLEDFLAEEELDP